MAVDFDRHNAAFQRSFGEAATYTPLTGDPLDVTIVLSNLAQAFPETATAAMEAIWVRRADFSTAPAKGDTVQIGERTLNVVTIRDDRAGGIYLGLN